MKCQSLFSEKNKKNIINLSPSELAQRVEKGLLFKISAVTCIKQNICIT